MNTFTILVAMKPLRGTYAQNVLVYGTGALNIDGARVGSEERAKRIPMGKTGNIYGAGLEGGVPDGTTTQGRFPANIALQDSDKVKGQFPFTQSGKGNFNRDSGSDRHGNRSSAYGAESRPAGSEMVSYGDQGSASRFYRQFNGNPT